MKLIDEARDYVETNFDLPAYLGLKKAAKSYGLLKFSDATEDEKKKAFDALKNYDIAQKVRNKLIEALTLARHLPKEE